MYCNFLQRILRLVAGYDTMPGFFACIYLYKNKDICILKIYMIKNKDICILKI